MESEGGVISIIRSYFGNRNDQQIFVSEMPIEDTVQLEIMDELENPSEISRRKFLKESFLVTVGAAASSVDVQIVCRGSNSKQTCKNI